LPINHLRTRSTEKASLRSIAALSRTHHTFRRGLVSLAAVGLLLGLAGSAFAQSTPTVARDVPANPEPPAGTVLVFELEARGVQIYTCDARADEPDAFVWTFRAPEAELFNQHGELVGTHFGGPTWQGNDGSAVIGEVLERADSPEPSAIPWLLLEAKGHVGSGVFATIAYVQRLDTAGGAAPSEGCDADHAGQEARQAYTAIYAYYYQSEPAAPVIATPDA
jgi:hypothetical protein